jgi:hypothetical protein
MIPAAKGSRSLRKGMFFQMGIMASRVFTVR